METKRPLAIKSSSTTLRLMLFVFLLILLAYWPSLRISFLSDDFVLLTEAQLGTLPQAVAVDANWFFYRPLGKLLWWAEFRVFGYQGLFYHAISLGLHWLNALLVITLARQFAPVWVAIGAGCLFALSPLHAETVTWLACQYDLLATCGYLAGLICLLHWVRQPKEQPAHRWLWYCAALLAFQLSLWSKETAFTFPVVAALLCFVARGRMPRRQVLVALLPFGALLGLNLLQRVLVWGSVGGYSTAPLSLEYTVIVLNHTVLTLLAPLNQLLFPPWAVQVWAVLVGLMLVVGVVHVSHRRMVVIGLAWLLITLVPVLTILPVGADLQNARVLYLPSVGLCFALAWCVDNKKHLLRPWPVTLAAWPLLAFMSVLAMGVQLGPWVVAGENTRHVAEEVHRLGPLFPPDSRLTVVNLPDNYMGAFVYRLGLNHAYAHYFEQTFALEAAPALPPLRYDLAGTEAQVEFGFDRTARRWGVAMLRSVGPEYEPLPGAQTWDITACPNDWQSPAPCIPGQGVQGLLESPPLEQAHRGWYELMVVAAVPPNAAEGEMLMEWRDAAGEWQSSHAASFNLPVDGGTYAYRLAINPADGGVPLHTLRITVDHGAIRRVILRPML